MILFALLLATAGAAVLGAVAIQLWEARGLNDYEQPALPDL